MSHQVGSANLSLRHSILRGASKVTSAIERQVVDLVLPLRLLSTADTSAYISLGEKSNMAIPNFKGPGKSNATKYENEFIFSNFVER